MLIVFTKFVLPGLILVKRGFLVTWIPYFDVAQSEHLNCWRHQCVPSS